ncbi:DUF4333 domain-containing protein [Actinomycetospora termitidis]|uniref:DUF4333 domain-containing protein n=1 Tax=Actinomycetospora termitidis TaxID=3053470 RepID=A0ABT7MBX8_9PSEU|nr:DUF4333 domain-containing protein [Actinomycetospora sp. Odt1-22]MDL5158181.1 DUF4333 domain-containing protein [Actinomycetospora sp. Odt1-22]
MSSSEPSSGDTGSAEAATREPTGAAEPEPDGPSEPTPPSGTARPTGVRWSETPAPARDDDATPPSGIATPGVPMRTTGPAPVPSPGAAWAAPGFAPATRSDTMPGWAPPPRPPADPARRRRVRRVLLAVLLGLVVVAAVVVALLAFLVGPRFARYDVLDRAAVERGVVEVVTRDWKRQATGVACPDDVRVRPGATFECTGTVDGRPVRIPVDVVDENGTYEVGQPR